MDRAADNNLPDHDRDFQSHGRAERLPGFGGEREDGDGAVYQGEDVGRERTRGRRSEVRGQRGMIAFTKAPVTELVYDLSFAHYAARPGISQSWLKLFDYESGGAPYKAKFYYENPELCPAPS